MNLSNFKTTILVACIITVLSLLYWNILTNFQFSPTSDEGYYYKYAQHIANKGNEGFEDLIKWYAGSDDARKHPAPIRVIYIAVHAFLFKIFGPAEELFGLTSFISFVVFLFVCFYAIRKHYSQEHALLTCTLLSSAPLLLGLSSRALIDSSVNMMWAICVWKFLECLLKPNRKNYILTLLFLILALLLKESSIILVAFFFWISILAKVFKKSDITFLQIAAITIVPLLVVAEILIIWLGGVDNFVMIAKAIFTTHFEANPPNYALNYSSGPWFRYLIDFMLLTPCVTILFFGYVGQALTRLKELDFKNGYFLLYFIFVYYCFNLLPHSKVVRFVVNLEMVMCLFAVLMLKQIEGNNRWIFFIIIGIFFYNLYSFKDLYYASHLLDPITYNLVSLRGFIPR